MDKTQSSCVVFGGSGYIGKMLARRFAESGRFSEITLADVRQPEFELPEGVRHVFADVREPIAGALLEARPEWIFNLAAVHREPGHAYEEYFDTNVPGARNVCAYAETVGCRNICFTSSIAVYGPTDKPTWEEAPKYPSTPYGISKLAAELIHEGWRRADGGRRLLVCRPGVVYGPEEPGNIRRMIEAVRKGVFFFPGDPNIRKSYAYIDGLLESFEFLMGRKEAQVVFNYVETPTEPLADLCRHAREAFGVRSRVVGLPLWALVPAAHAAQALSSGKSAIHPVRVRKAATPTHIVPQALLDLGFPFKRSFRASLDDWRRSEPEL